MSLSSFFYFFFSDTATTEIYTLSLHDALPIFHAPADDLDLALRLRVVDRVIEAASLDGIMQVASPVGREHDHRRSEEHTSELQSQSNLVCRLLLEKKKKNKQNKT